MRAGQRTPRAISVKPEAAVGRADLLAILGNWSSGDASLYAQLADAVAGCATRGDLAPGTRLPAERDLAIGLSVSRGTVMAAYARLRQLGWAESRRGSGTWIRSDARRPLVPARQTSEPAHRSRHLAGHLLHPAPGIVDLAVAAVRDTDDLPDDLFEVSTASIRAVTGNAGYAPQGALQLREQLAARHRDSGTATTADQIVITAGGQQGIDLCAALALRPGDTVLVEEATYPGAIDVFARHGARIRTVPLQGSWGESRPLAEAIELHRPRLVYLMPSMHNPTGRTASELRRKQLARLADEHELYLVEDDTSAELTFEGRRTPPVAAHSKAGRVLTISSFSKTVWGGMRVGWVRAAPAVAERLGQIKAAKDLGVSAFAQAAALGMVPRLDEIAEARSALFRGRAAVLEQLLSDRLPDWSWSDPDGGLALWVRLPNLDAEVFAQRALRAGVAVSPGAAHCYDQERTDRLRVSFAARPEILTEGVNRLAVAWHEHVARHRRPASA